MRKLLIVSLLLVAACGEEAAPEPLPAPPTTGCENVHIRKSEGADHISSNQPTDYGTEPPTSGDHYGRWVETGLYEEPVPDGNLVHNLEHGAVIIWVNGLSDAQLADLREVVRRQPQWIIVMPRPAMRFPIAFTAWARIQRCAQVPANLVEHSMSFFGANARVAPETIAATPLG